MVRAMHARGAGFPHALGTDIRAALGGEGGGWHIVVWADHAFRSVAKIHKTTIHNHSRMYLTRFPTSFFQSSTLAIIRILRRACDVTLSNDTSGRGGGHHTPPPHGLCGGPVKRDCKYTGLDACLTIPLQRTARRLRYVSRRDAFRRMYGYCASALQAVVLGEY